MRTIDTRKYVYAFLLTAAIFVTALVLSNHLGQKKIQELRSIQDQIAIDILSSEVQTALLEQFSCRDVANNALSQELGSLGEKLAFMEESRGTDDAEVMALKRYYSLLQIKDYILMNKVREKCGTRNEFIIYFYGPDCADCERQGHVLTKLRQDYPDLRVYSFDYTMDLSAIKTLISVNRVKPTLPALLIREENYYGFKAVEDLKQIIPQLSVWDKEKAEKEKSATSTERSAPSR